MFKKWHKDVCPHCGQLIGEYKETSYNTFQGERVPTRKYKGRSGGGRPYHTCPEEDEHFHRVAVDSRAGEYIERERTLRGEADFDDEVADRVAELRRQEGWDDD